MAFQHVIFPVDLQHDENFLHLNVLYDAVVDETQGTYIVLDIYLVKQLRKFLTRRWRATNSHFGKVAFGMDKPERVHEPLQGRILLFGLGQVV